MRTIATDGSLETSTRTRNSELETRNSKLLYPSLPFYFCVDYDARVQSKQFARVGPGFPAGQPGWYGDGDESVSDRY